MKQINNIFKETSIKFILIVFIIIQPIFDLKIFYNSISTLIRVIFISLFFLYYFINDKNTKKYWLFIYPFLIILYFIFHHLNALSFHSLVPGDFNYTSVTEVLYLIKMICPFMLIYCLFKANLSSRDTFFIVTVIVLFISTIIIFSNIFIFSYGSYSDTKIKANFFAWFNNSSYTYQDLASKGLFELGNQISVILLMFLPFTIYFVFKNKNKLNLIVLVFNIFALILLCTKVAVLGIGLVFIYTIIFYIIKKHCLKNILPIAIVFLIYVLLLPVNPSFSRMFERQKIIETASSTIIEDSTSSSKSIEENSYSAELENSISTDYKISYIESNYKDQKINENFILNRYPYKYDNDFWYDLLTNNNPTKSDYRYLELSMVKRVWGINNNKYDKLFGITYTRIQNIFNIEKDFIMQYYSLGILGLILFIFPYFLILGYCIIKFVLKKFSNIYLFLSIVTIFMIFAIAYYSGNLLNSLSFTIYFALLYFILLKSNELED